MKNSRITMLLVIVILSHCLLTIQGFAYHNPQTRISTSYVASQRTCGRIPCTNIASSSKNISVTKSVDKYSKGKTTDLESYTQRNDNDSLWGKKSSYRLPRSPKRTLSSLKTILPSVLFLKYIFHAPAAIAAMKRSTSTITNKNPLVLVAAYASRLKSGILVLLMSFLSKANEATMSLKTAFLCTVNQVNFLAELSLPNPLPAVLAFGNRLKSGVLLLIMTIWSKVNEFNFLNGLSLQNPLLAVSALGSRLKSGILFLLVTFWSKVNKINFPAVSVFGSKMKSDILLLLMNCWSIVTSFRIPSKSITTYWSKLDNFIILKRVKEFTRSYQKVILQNPKTAIRKTAILLILAVTVSSLYDTIRTRKRQSLDATSEWGRYSDYPSIRGRAIFSLMLRIAPAFLVSRILNYLPSGDYFIFRSKAESTKQQSDESKSAETLSSKPWAGRKSAKLRQQSGAMFAEGLLRLGPLYIKIGQILSCRKDLLSDEWKTSLERLQDRVPAKSGTEALELAYEAYGGEENFRSTFKDFDDVPLAAASLGQVHRAQLNSNYGNATVAIKLQRSRLRDIYDKDLALMSKIAKIVDSVGGKAGNVGGVQQSWQDIFKDAEEILYREIDYRDEATNAIQFAKDFGLGLGGEAITCAAKSLDKKDLSSAAEWMRTPFVYEDLSTEKVLVMEYVPSIKISDTQKLKEAGVSVQDKEVLAGSLARAYLRQFCVNRFFSTDPHPGNLGVEIIKNNEDKVSCRLVFYDFGQACSLKDDQAGGILDVIEGIIDINVDSCVNAFDRMGVLVDGADLDKVRAKVRNNFETGKVKVKRKKSNTVLRDESSSLSQAVIEDKNEIDQVPMNVTMVKTASDEEVKDKEIMSFFTLPAEYAFVARAISQMDGVGKSLDSEFEFISAVAPHLIEIKGSDKYIADEMKKSVSKAEEFISVWQSKFIKIVDIINED